ncbi:MAG: PTS sugar transporter [Lachnospiraceae bacterium]|nr:PTS sugar transporter [Lachnospiraceae bacterium]
MKRIAIVGSSGGNLFRQGGNDPDTMMKEIFTQAKSAGIEVAYIQFVGTNASMDHISDTAPAKLYTLDGGGIKASEEGTLAEVNAKAVSYDEELAKMIADHQVDGMVLMSADPKGANVKAITAAAETGIPIVGTGGTSVANTQSMGCNVVSASGTTGTTNRTRAVAFISSFAKEWNLKYSPVIGSSAGAKVQDGNVWKRINFRGIMMAAMPGFIAMALCLALSKLPGLSAMEDMFNTLIGVLPVILAAIAAKQVSGLDEVGIVAGIVAGILSVDGGIIGGLVVGILAGVMAYYIITFCLKHKVPGTTANIAAGGISGLVAGVIGMFLIAPVALWLGDSIKGLIDMALNYNAVLAGAIAGFMIWFAIIGGVYHAAILPIVLLEMESTGFSFLGAIDMCGLVLVCAGILLANIVKPRHKGDVAASVPGLFINLCFGTFVEAAYPFMFSSKKVFASAIAAATLSGAFVGLLGVKCTAYVPTFIAPTLANEGKAVAMIICMLIAIGCAFVLALLSNVSDKKKDEKTAVQEQ